MTTMTHRAWWRQLWEIGGQPALQEDDHDLARVDPENAHEDGQDSRQDDDEWRDWRVDDPELDISDEWDEGGGTFTWSNHANC